MGGTYAALHRGLRAKPRVVPQLSGVLCSSCTHCLFLRTKHPIPREVARFTQYLQKALKM